MIRVALLNETSEAHLDEVKKEMGTLGAPTIKAIAYETADNECDYIALEGSHRIMAAIDLEIDDKINFVVVGYVNEIYGNDYKLSDFVEPDADDYSIDYLIDMTHRAPLAEINQDID